MVGSGLAGFGFGAGAAERLAPATASYADSSGAADYGAGEVPLTGQVDGEVAQCIRHLAKKDPITKTKALQVGGPAPKGGTTADTHPNLCPSLPSVDPL